MYITLVRLLLTKLSQSPEMPKSVSDQTFRSVIGIRDLCGPL